jgi:hypothetical protein
MVAIRPMTREDVERMGSAGERMELIDGEPRRKAGVSQRHGEIEAQIFVPWAHTSIRTDSAESTPPTPSSPCRAIRTRS